MPVSLNRFSDIAARQNVSDSGVVTLDSSRDLRLNQSRFRLVRWMRDAGIGKRLSNRRTVAAFISSLQHHYGPEVTSRMDFGPLRDLQRRGKPLHVRDIKVIKQEADMVADNLRLVKDSMVEGLVNDRLAGAAYLALPGGEDLAREVRNQVDMATTLEDLPEDLFNRPLRDELPEGYNLYTAKKRVNLAVSDALKKIFLTGYGVSTARGRQCDKLQQVFDRHPQARELKARYGPGFDASRVSETLYQKLSEKLTDKLHVVMMDPEQLPGAGPVRERVEHALDEVAEQVVDNFVNERAGALERLYDLHAQGEIRSEDMASFGRHGYSSLAAVVLHHRIPPDMISALYALRRQVPDNLVDLASPGHTMEHGIGVLGQLGSVVDGIYKEISDDDRRKYALGLDNKLNFTRDCGHFLLEGKLSAEDGTALRDAVRADAAGSDLQELCRGIADMRAGMYGSDVKKEHWEAARDPLNNMSLATVLLLGTDAPSLIGEYTPRAGNVLTAMRNWGIEAPPPGNYEVEQSGKGKFSRPALEIAFEELQEDLGKDQLDSPVYPGFPDEAIQDFNRAEFVIDGEEIKRGDVDGVVEGLKNFCTDRHGNLDEMMLDIVGQLVYQRTNNLAYGRFTFGGKRGVNDSVALLRTAPFIGNPTVSFASSYDVSRDGNGNISVRIRCEGPAKHLKIEEPQAEFEQYLDPDRSNVQLDIALEVDAQDYSVKLTGMNYEYRLIPGEEP